MSVLNLLLVVLLHQVLLLLVGHSHEENRQEAGREQQGEGRAPAGLLGDQADDPVRQDKGAEEIAEEARQARCRTGRVLRGKVQRLHADEHYGPINEEADADQGDDDDGEVVNEGPVQADEHRDEGHEDHRRQRAAALEELVRQPAAEEGARDGGELIREVGPAGALEVDTLLREDGGRPVQAAIADHIDEGVRQGDEPQELVVQDVVEEDFLRGDGRLVLLGVVLGIVVAPLFHGREAAGLRRVAQQDVGQEGDEQGDRRREGESADQEIQFRVGTVEPAAEPGSAIGGHRADEGAADVMGAVPDGHHRPPLAHGEPVRHHAAARGPSHAVEPAHEGVQDAHHQDGEGLVLRADELDRDEHEAHRDGREDEAQGQEHAGVGAV